MNLDPSQFEVNEAWILFQLTEKPIVTQLDGSFICYGLMDVASCFMLGVTPHRRTDDSAILIKKILGLIKTGWEHKKEFPERLLVIKELLTTELEFEIRAQGIYVNFVEEFELESIIRDAQDEFRKQFG